VRLICEAGTRRSDHACHGSAVGILASNDEEDVKNRLGSRDKRPRAPGYTPDRRPSVKALRPSSGPGFTKKIPYECVSSRKREELQYADRCQQY
jgi:hypothetical protein